MLKVESIKFTDANDRIYIIQGRKIESFPLIGGEEANMITSQVWNQHGTTPIEAFIEAVERELIFIINTSDMQPKEIEKARREIVDICNPLNGTLKMTVVLNGGSIYNRDVTFTSAPSFPIGFENRNNTWQKVQLFYTANNPFWYDENEIVESFQAVEPLFEFSFSNEVTKPNLIPSPTFEDLTKFTDSFSVMNFTTEQNNTILRGEMIAFETNQKMRVVTSSTNRANLIAGTSYTFSFKLLTSIKLKTLNFTQLMAYDPDNTTYTWVDYGANIDLVNLQTDADGYSIYSSSFVATKTGTARFGLGFDGASNPELANGVWFKVKDLDVSIQSITGYVQPTIVFGEVIPNSTVVNTGQADAPIVIEIKGACVNPRIENETTGEFIQFKNLTMVSTDELIIDTTFGQKRVELNGVNIFNKLDFSSTFFNLARGENIIDFTDDNGAITTTIHFIYRNLYITI